MQNVTLTPEVSLENITDLEKWDAVIAGNDRLLEKYITGETLTVQELKQEEYEQVQKG